MDLRISLIALFVFCGYTVAALPSDNFNDNTIGNLWTLYNDDASKVWLQEINQRLELGSISGSTEEEALYISTWDFSTSASFTMKIDYHHSKTGTGDSWVQFGIGALSGDFIMFGAGYDGYPYFWYEAFAEGSVVDIGGELRATQDGTLYISYDSVSDAVYVSKTGYGSADAMRTITGVIKGYWGAASINVWCGGGADGEAISSGEAYLDNFIAESGTTIGVPPDEPDNTGLLVAWGDNTYGQCNVSDGNYIAIAAGYEHATAIKSDGSLAAWGRNDFGQCNVPQGSNYTAVSSLSSHNLALKSDGTLVSWGENDYGQCNVPAGNNYKAISAGGSHSVALKSDGSLVAWGNNDVGQCDFPSGNNYTAIAAGGNHNLALKSDGSIVAWGWNPFGECDVPAGNNYIAIAANQFYSLALKSDGSLIAWGDNWQNQCSVPAGYNYTAIAAGEYHGLALKSDGSLAAWGNNYASQCNVPAGNGFAAISAGGYYSLALIYVPGDFDNSGREDMVDFAILAQAWNSQAGQPNWNPVCDISVPKDNIIGWSDLSVFMQGWLAGVE